jgi:hypothetical protein
MNTDKESICFDLQREIAKKIHSEPKTEDQLRKLIPEATSEELANALRSMLLLKLIKKEGYPVKYHISEDISNKLSERRHLSETDKNSIRINIIIESKSDNKVALRKAMDVIAEGLKKDKVYSVYELTVAEIIVHDDLFSTYITAELSCPDIASIIKLIYYYGVTSVDVIKPDKLQVHMSDIQSAMMTVVDMAHGYADIIFKLKRQLAEVGKLKK